MNKRWDSPITSNGSSHFFTFNLEKGIQSIRSVIFHNEMWYEVKINCNWVFWNNLFVFQVVIGLFLHINMGDTYLSTIDSDDIWMLPDIFDLFDLFFKGMGKLSVLNCVSTVIVPKNASLMVESFFEFRFQTLIVYSNVLFEIGITISKFQVGLIELWMTLDLNSLSPSVITA